MDGEKILIVDDDDDIKEVLSLYLHKEGFQIFCAYNGNEALKIIDTKAPDLIFLDIVLPDLDGFEICQLIRKKTDVPIIFLSGKQDDIDTILGLRIGGDDYVTKPFHPGVLIARIKAHLRRSRQNQLKQMKSKETDQMDRLLKFPDLTIDTKSCVVKKNQHTIILSAKEYRLLCLLAKNPDQVYQVEQLFQLIWGEDSLGDYRTVMVHISNLRKKIEYDPSNPIYIKTVRGIGYKFNGFQDL
ncbi:response regulator transcription factor [Bacillus sp. 03113]|uniref:response regulator transcription factor n=1 Tax=Bacillus sp. 03113 TaxID=2578211 RepID=UPI00114110FF|nr:response regulator transcription factor [Bacillus sp. 03113]